MSRGATPCYGQIIFRCVDGPPFLFFSFFSFFKDFYLFIHERHRERERKRHRQREKQAPRREADVGLDPGSRDHALRQRQIDAQPLSHPGVPGPPFLIHSSAEGHLGHSPLWLLWIALLWALVYKLFFSFSQLINLFIHERHREGETQAEGEAGSTQGAQRGTRSRISRTTLWAKVALNCWAPPGCPNLTSLGSLFQAYWCFLFGMGVPLACSTDLGSSFTSFWDSVDFSRVGSPMEFLSFLLMWFD